MRKRCPECGFPNAERAVFCECGYEFVGWEERPTGGGRDGSLRASEVERRRQAAMAQPVPQRGSGRGALVGAILGGVLRPLVVLLYGSLDPHGFAAPPNFGCIFTDIGLPIAVVLALVDGLWIGGISGYLANPGSGRRLLALGLHVRLFCA